MKSQLIMLFALIYSTIAVSLEEISSILSQKQYQGTWYSNKPFDQFHFLDKRQGDSFMIFLRNISMFSGDSKYPIVITKLEFQLLNPHYQEENQVFGILNLENYDAQENSWMGNTKMNCTGEYKFRREFKETCDIDYQVQVRLDSDINKVQVFVDIQSTTDECQINFKADYMVDTYNYSLQVVLYCLYVIGISAIQFICLTKLCKYLMDNEHECSKFSLLTFGYITIYHSYLCMQNLYFALINYMFFQYFIIPAFFYFLLSTTCDMKLIWMIWRSQQLVEVLDNRQIRRAISIFFAQFYTGLLVFFVLMYIFELYYAFILINGLFILPQIIHNAIKGNRAIFNYYYIFGVLLINLMIPLYFRGCPENFRGLKPSLTFCIIWIFLFAFQIFILYIQFKFGPRSFIPKFCLPKAYNYFKVHCIQNDEQDDDCAICLNQLSIKEEENGQLEKLLLNKIMITPCGHQFHTECLQSWMNVKLQCPSCRKTIPPVQ